MVVEERTLRTDGLSTAVLETIGVQWGSEKLRVEAILSRLPGVSQVDANPVAQTATVTFDPTLTSVVALRDWIRDCGYHCAGQSVPASILSTPLPILIGRLSYSLYLWHAPIFFEIGKRTTDWPGAGRVIFAWGLSFAAAGATYHFVERPLLRRKDGLGRRMPPIASPRPSVPAARA